MKRIKMRMAVAGAHLGNPEGTKVGDVLEVDDGIADSYVKQGYASRVSDDEAVSAGPGKVETATAPESETAALDTEAGGESQPVKRGPGRPPKEAPKEVQ